MMPSVPIRESGIAITGIKTERRRSQEGEYHQHDDDQGLDEGHDDLVNGDIHEVSRVVHDVRFEAARQLRVNVGKDVAHALDDGE